MTTGPLQSILRPGPIGTRCKWLMRSGFTLVEVTLALGILAFAAIPMVGLVANGLASVHSSLNASVTAAIVQQVDASLHRLTNSVLGSQRAQTLYFSNEGALVTGVAASVYTATLTKPTFPAKGIFTAQNAASQLYQVELTVSYAPGGAANATDVAKSTILITPID